jgi:hypothetical protein
MDGASSMPLGFHRQLVIDTMETPNLTNLLNDCERLSISVHEKASFELKLLKDQFTILKDFANDIAEGDCDYGDNCPKGSRHGVCYSCQARKALFYVTTLNELDTLRDEVASLKIQLAEARGERDPLY